jgi:predicted nuclease with TOPRIM domain
MNKTCETHHVEEIRKLLGNLSTCITDISEKLELIDELRDEIDSEFDEYTNEMNELEFTYAHLTEELEDVRAALPTADKKEILQKLFMFDAVTPMTQPERTAVYSFILSGQESTKDVCWSAGQYLTEYRRDNSFICYGESELPFETNVEETVANLL